MSNVIVDTILPFLPGRRKNASGNWISFNAVCCPHRGETRDKRSRGGVKLSPEGGIAYHCFNCQFKTSWQPGRYLGPNFRKWLGWLGMNQDQVDQLRLIALRTAKEDIPLPKIEPIKFDTRPLPDETRTFEQFELFFALSAPKTNFRNLDKNLMDVVSYAIDRCVDVRRYKFAWSSSTNLNMHRRLIVPFYWKGDIVGYTARAVDGTIKLKYLNSFDPQFVFNMDLQTEDKEFVIVSEGPFDAMSVDGVAVLTNEISSRKAEIIDSLRRPVIVVPHCDKAGLKLIEAALQYKWQVSIPPWLEEAKDINEATKMYGRIFVLKTIYDYAVKSELKIKLATKTLQSYIKHRDKILHAAS